jgi:diguanylate cyclase (GGDEF)-like protein
MASELSSYAHPSQPWNRPSVEPRAPMVWNAALMYLCGGFACLTAVALPLIATAHRPVLLFVGLFGCTIAATLWIWGRHLPPWSFALLSALGTLLVSLIVAICSTGGSVKTAALAYLCVAVYYGRAFSRRMVYAQWLVFAASFAAALLLDGFPGMVSYWAVLAALVLIVGLALSRDTDMLRRRADTDPLTGLPNRNGLYDAAQRVHREGMARRARRPRACAVIDLNGFKQINDTLGHPVGDQLLAELAQAWRRCLRTADIAARIGGDEFVVLMPNTSRRGAEGILRRMREAVVLVAGKPVTWSNGLCMWRHGETIDECIKRADEALYENKRRARSRRNGLE